MNDIKIAVLSIISIVVACLTVFAFTVICYAESPVDLSKAVIHHTDTKDVPIEVIRRYHVEEKGWDEVGYHFLIRTNGDLEYGRSLRKKGAHAIGRNHWVGIALCGRDEFTSAQVVTLRRLLKALRVKTVARHHERCPSQGLNVEAIQREIK